MFSNLSTDFNKKDGNKHSRFLSSRVLTRLSSSFEARFGAEATITRPPVGSSAEVRMLLSLSHSQLKQRSNIWRRQRDGASTAQGHRCHRWHNAAISLASWQSAALSEEHLQLQDSYVQLVLLPTFLGGFCGEDDCRSQNGWRSVRNADGFMGNAA